jgi:hypothetical protein
LVGTGVFDSVAHSAQLSDPDATPGAIYGSAFEEARQMLLRAFTTVRDFRFPLNNGHTAPASLCLLL